MRLKEEQIKHLAAKVYDGLVNQRLAILRKDQKDAGAAIAGAIRSDISREQLLEQDAEKLLDSTIASIGQAGAEIDRRKMLKMVKEKLARERRIIIGETEDRISNLSHEVLDALCRDGQVELVDKGRALGSVKQTLTAFYRVAGEIDDTVRARLRNRVQGSRDWEALYQKFYLEELARHKL